MTTSEQRWMRAVVHDRYGPPEVLRLEEVARPVPGRDDVLVRVYATTVTRTDCHVRRASPFVWRLFTGLRRPRRRILGMEFAGRVVEIGAAVRGYEAGDEVFGISGWDFGAHAEYVRARGDGPLALKPADTSFELAAASLDGPTDALAKLRRARVERGQRILIYGASGSIGTAAVQLSKALGADVTAVCDTRNLMLVRALGADAVIDYTGEDFTARGETFDVIFDAVGKTSFARCRRSLNAGGRYLFTDGWINLVWLLATVVWRRKRVLFATQQRGRADVAFVKGLIEAGRYRAVVDRTYPLEAIVDAARYVETGQKVGNVVLTVGSDAILVQ